MQNEMSIEEGDSEISPGQSETISGWIIRRDRDCTFSRRRFRGASNGVPRELQHSRVSPFRIEHEPEPRSCRDGLGYLLRFKSTSGTPWLRVG
jgi:hypothetical protein